MNQTLVNVIMIALLLINTAMISYCVYKKSAEEFRLAKKSTFAGATTTAAPAAGPGPKPLSRSRALR